VLIVFFAGCALFSPPVDKQAEQRRARREAALRQLEQGRDAAELHLALECWRQQDVAGCRQRLQALLARNPGYFEARLLLAEVLLADHRPQAAVAQLEPLLPSHAEDPQLQYFMGLALDASGQSDKALPFYQRAARLQPGNELYTVSYQKADAARQTPLPQPDALRDPFAGTIPTDNRVVAASCAEPAAEGVPAKVVRLETSTTKSSDLAGLAAEELIAEGGRALSAGSDHRALACFREAIAKAPETPRIPIAAALSALERNRADLAAGLLEPAAKAFPDVPAVHRTLGITYYRLGNYPSSQKALQQALQLDKSSALSYFLMACTLAKLGRAEAAEAHFRQAHSLDPRYAAQDAAGINGAATPGR
jgi:tetratricopeptide (TPR) repeat protein